MKQIAWLLSLMSLSSFLAHRKFTQDTLNQPYEDSEITQDLPSDQELKYEKVQVPKPRLVKRTSSNRKKFQGDDGEEYVDAFLKSEFFGIRTDIIKEFKSLLDTVYEKGVETCEIVEKQEDFQKTITGIIAKSLHQLKTDFDKITQQMNDLFLEKVEDFTALYVYLLKHFKAIEQILRVCSKEKDVQQKTLDKYCRDGYFALQEANEDKIGAEKMRLRRRTREEIGQEQAKDEQAKGEDAGDSSAGGVESNIYRCLEKHMSMMKQFVEKKKQEVEKVQETRSEADIIKSLMQKSIMSGKATQKCQFVEATTPKCPEGYRLDFSSCMRDNYCSIVPKDIEPPLRVISRSWKKLFQSEITFKDLVTPLQKKFVYFVSVDEWKCHLYCMDLGPEHTAAYMNYPTDKSCKEASDDEKRYFFASEKGYFEKQTEFDLKNISTATASMSRYQNKWCKPNSFVYKNPRANILLQIVGALQYGQCFNQFTNSCESLGLIWCPLSSYCAVSVGTCAMHYLNVGMQLGFLALQTYFGFYWMPPGLASMGFLAQNAIIGGIGIGLAMLNSVKDQLFDQVKNSKSNLEYFIDIRENKMALNRFKQNIILYIKTQQGKSNLDLDNTTIVQYVENHVKYLYSHTDEDLRKMLGYLTTMTKPKSFIDSALDFFSSKPKKTCNEINMAKFKANSLDQTNDKLDRSKPFNSEPTYKPEDFPTCKDDPTFENKKSLEDLAKADDPASVETVSKFVTEAGFGALATPDKTADGSISMEGEVKIAEALFENCMDPGIMQFAKMLSGDSCWDMKDPFEEGRTRLELSRFGFKKKDLVTNLWRYTFIIKDNFEINGKEQVTYYKQLGYFEHNHMNLLGASDLLICDKSKKVEGYENSEIPPISFGMLPGGTFEIQFYQRLIFGDTSAILRFDYTEGPPPTFTYSVEKGNSLKLDIDDLDLEIQDAEGTVLTLTKNAAPYFEAKKAMRFNRVKPKRQDPPKINEFDEQQDHQNKENQEENHEQQDHQNEENNQENHEQLDDQNEEKNEKNNEENQSEHHHHHNHHNHHEDNENNQDQEQ